MKQKYASKKFAAKKFASGRFAGLGVAAPNIATYFLPLVGQATLAVLRGPATLAATLRGPSRKQLDQ